VILLAKSLDGEEINLEEHASAEWGLKYSSNSQTVFRVTLREMDFFINFSNVYTRGLIISY
jgi:hypothetical protein